MSLYPGLDAPRKKQYYRFWTLVFFALLAAGIIAVFFATRSIDYNWRWYRVPQYFIYLDTIEVKAEIEGEVTAISEASNETVVTVSDGSASEIYPLPSASDLRISQGDFLYPGDTIGTYQKWKVGLLLLGLWITLKASFISIILAMIIGVLTGLARISDNPALKWTAITYIELVRGSPLLVQMMIWYFVIGTLINQLFMHWGWSALPTIWYGIFSLAIFTGAYTAEIVRAGIQSIHVGQMEAARSLGLTYVDAMRLVILPQAIKRILPALAGQFISLIKDSSLLGVISIRELTKVTREVVTASLQPFELWIVCALLYLILTFALSLWVQRLERRAAR